MTLNWLRARAGANAQDFAASEPAEQRTVTIPAGQTSVTVTINVAGDADV